jgi:hypothetical protein
MHLRWTFYPRGALDLRWTLAMFVLVLLALLRMVLRIRPLFRNSGYLVTDKLWRLFLILAWVLDNRGQRICDGCER